MTILGLSLFLLGMSRYVIPHRTSGSAIRSWHLPVLSSYIPSNSIHSRCKFPAFPALSPFSRDFALLDHDSPFLTRIQFRPCSMGTALRDVRTKDSDPRPDVRLHLLERGNGNGRERSNYLHYPIFRRRVSLFSAAPDALKLNMPSMASSPVTIVGG